MKISQSYIADTKPDRQTREEKRCLPRPFGGKYKTHGKTKLHAGRIQLSQYVLIQWLGLLGRIRSPDP